MNPPSSSVPLLIRRRRWTAILTLPTALALAVFGPWFGNAAYTSIEGGLGTALAAVGAIVFLGAAAIAWNALKGVVRTEPVLVLDANGITDDLRHHVFVPWSDIASATVDYGDGDRLVITLRDGVSLPGGRIVRRGLARAARRAFNGGDLAIPLASLGVDHAQLRRALESNIGATSRERHALAAPNPPARRLEK